MDFFNDYAKVRPKLACRLIHYEKNRQLLEKLPHRRFLDMAVVYCCIMMSDHIGCACVRSTTTIYGIMAGFGGTNSIRIPWIICPVCCLWNFFLHG